MNLLTAIALTAAATGSTALAQVTLDQNTKVPVSAFIGSAITIFLVGMWVSRKVTRFEEQQVSNTLRLAALEDRMLRLEDKR